jgi:hypothetical protein
MEYILGSLTTLITIAILYRIINVKTNKIRLGKDLIRSQSYIHDLVKFALPSNAELKARKPTQAKKHYEELFTRVIIVEDDVYWISNNSLLFAKLVDGIIDQDSINPVDIMAMDKVELDKMIFIVDTLTEGTANDNRNSGNKEL